jgi:hypothetical protein
VLLLLLVGYEAARNEEVLNAVQPFYVGPRGGWGSFYGIFDGFEGILRFVGVLGVL